MYLRGNYKMKLQRELDATRLNKIINTPEIFKWVKLPNQDYIDVTKILQNLNNFALVMDKGGSLFIQQEPGIYEVHNNYLPTVRGFICLGLIKNALKYMFIRTDCMKVLSKIPVNNEAAKGMARLLHAQLMFTRKNAWPTSDNEAIDIEYYELTYQDWLDAHNKLDAIESGKWFHERIELLTGDIIQHAECNTHDTYVGVAVEMILAGNVDKGVIHYNQWARFAGYQLIEIAQRHPLVINIGNALLEITMNGDFNLLKKV